MSEEEVVRVEESKISHIPNMTEEELREYIKNMKELEENS